MPRLQLIQKLPRASSRNLKDAVVEEAFAGRVAREPAVLEAAQAAVVGADPEHALAVFVQRPHHIARQPSRSVQAVNFPSLRRVRPP